MAMENTIWTTVAWATAVVSMRAASRPMGRRLSLVMDYRKWRRLLRSGAGRDFCLGEVTAR
ncbi:hypothetical protein EYF80_032164 [Liparis tanakae]|uniref:Uncharacterized protein n=1 Tax=Liparis tanakae TaxID=230148 RepID=A0A4Z2GYE6_9TELE|nr:hypothetical protein EYF80_032164 [Liparis tanakae]